MPNTQMYAHTDHSGYSICSNRPHLALVYLVYTLYTCDAAIDVRLIVSLLTHGLLNFDIGPKFIFFAMT